MLESGFHKILTIFKTLIRMDIEFSQHVFKVFNFLLVHFWIKNRDKSAITFLMKIS